MLFVIFHVQGLATETSLLASDSFINKLTMSSGGSSDERIEPETLSEFTSITLTTLSTSMGANAEGVFFFFVFKTFCSHWAFLEKNLTQILLANAGFFFLLESEKIGCLDSKHYMLPKGRKQKV